MNIKAIIPSGQTEITVNGLHQWDYGQSLEICSNDLPALVEVHFACSGMTEAVVRSCSSFEKDGIQTATAIIPDRCVEQTTPIVAWVYQIDNGGTSARTIATIRMPIIARAKPSPSASVPTVITDKYTELIGAINEEVGALQQGKVVVTKALKADHATEAGHAINADKATNADNATNATNADSATNAEHATNAENAANATKAEKANELNFSLVGKATITSGKTATEADRLPQGVLEKDCVYLAKFYPTVAVGIVDSYTSIFTFNPDATFTAVLLDRNLKADICADDNCGHVEMVKINDGQTYWSTATEVNGIFSVYKIGTFTT